MGGTSSYRPSDGNPISGVAMDVMAEYARVAILTQYFFGCSAEVCGNCWVVVLLQRHLPDALVVGPGSLVFYNTLLPETPVGAGSFTPLALSTPK